MTRTRVRIPSTRRRSSATSVCRPGVATARTVSTKPPDGIPTPSCSTIRSARRAPKTTTKHAASMMRRPSSCRPSSPRVHSAGVLRALPAAIKPTEMRPGGRMQIQKIPTKTLPRAWTGGRTSTVGAASTERGCITWSMRPSRPSRVTTLRPKGHGHGPSPPSDTFLSRRKMYRPYSQRRRHLRPAHRHVRLHSRHPHRHLPGCRR